jgi:hypothetical protein
MISHLMQSLAEILQNGHVIVINSIHVLPEDDITSLF